MKMEIDFSAKLMSYSNTLRQKFDSYDWKIDATIYS